LLSKGAVDTRAVSDVQEQIEVEPLPQGGQDLLNPHAPKE